MSIIAFDDAAENPRASRIARSSRTIPSAVTRLLIPASKARSSSTPRQTSMPVTPRAAIADAHRLADRGVHFVVGVAPRVDTKRAAVERAEETVADVQAGLEREPAGLHRVEQAGKDRDFDRARRMKPAIAVQAPREAGEIVEDADADRPVAERGHDRPRARRECGLEMLGVAH